MEIVTAQGDRACSVGENTGSCPVAGVVVTAGDIVVGDGGCCTARDLNAVLGGDGGGSCTLDGVVVDGGVGASIIDRYATFLEASDGNLGLLVLIPRLSVLQICKDTVQEKMFL